MNRNKLHPLPPGASRRPTRIHIPLEKPRHIPHNLPVRADKPNWYLAFGRDKPLQTNYYFKTGGGNAAIRGPNEGWTQDDAESFNRYLHGLG